MLKFKNLSITDKLTYLVMVTCGTALIVASSVRIGIEIHASKRAMLENLSMLANVVGTQSAAALAFNDKSNAKEVLSPLRADPNILAAKIISVNGELFAEYQGPGKTGSTPRKPTSAPEKAAYRIDLTQIEVTEPINLDGEIIGAVVIQSKLQPLYASLLRNAATAGLVLATAALIAYLLSYKLQRLISFPIVRLAKTMKRVSGEQDYSLRLKRSGDDEIGSLITGFNTMLDEIQKRDNRLTKHQELLEKQVAERTKDLSQANQGLRLAIADASRAKGAAEAANQAKSEFLARMSHELRTGHDGIVAGYPAGCQTAKIRGNRKQFGSGTVECY